MATISRAAYTEAMKRFSGEQKIQRFHEQIHVYLAVPN
jgi:hypothetical protein